MKTQLFFTALLMAVAGMGTQDVYAEDENATLPSKLAYYDFEDEEGIELGHVGVAQNVTPIRTKMLNTHVLRFTCGVGGKGQGYARIVNPFMDTDVSTTGVTISVWVRRESMYGGSYDAVWSMDKDDSFSLRANSFNICGTETVIEPTMGEMSMMTVSIASDKSYTLYLNGEQKATGNIADDIFARIKDASQFCMGEINGKGTFTGSIDDLTFLAQSLTGTEVKQLYEEQHKNWSDLSMAAKEMVEGQSLGVTYLLPNASFSIYSLAPWNGVSGPFEYDHWNSDTYKGFYVESNTAPKQNVDVFYQEVNGLLPGMYRVTAHVGARKEVKLPEQTTCESGFELFANSGRKPITSKVLDELTVEGMVGNDGKLRLGVLATKENTNRWVCMADVRLEYLGSSVEFAEEDETTAPVAAFYNVVKVKRAMRQDVWNTFCVPFPMTSDQLSANGIKEVRVLDEATVGTDHVTLKFTQVDAIEPGKPYIVKVSVPVSEIKVSGVALQSSMNDIPSNGVTMKGNYAKGVVPDGAFFINNNAFYLADTENSTQKVTLKGFRAYIEVSEPVVSNINRMLIDIDGETTSVEEAFGEEMCDADRLVEVYTLSGVKVKSGVKPSEALDGLKKGIYVVEGKKVIK